MPLRTILRVEKWVKVQFPCRLNDLRKTSWGPTKLKQHSTRRVIRLQMEDRVAEKKLEEALERRIPVFAMHTSGPFNRVEVTRRWGQSLISWSSAHAPGVKLGSLKTLLHSVVDWVWIRILIHSRRNRTDKELQQELRFLI